MLLFYIILGDRNPPYPAFGSNIPSARRPGQRFHFLQCRVSSPSLRFVNRHGGTLRRAGWVAFTKTYSRGKWLISHLRTTCAIIIHIPRPLCLCISRPHVPVPHVPASHSPSSRVPRVPTHVSRCPHPLVPVSLLYTAYKNRLLNCIKRFHKTYNFLWKTRDSLARGVLRKLRPSKTKT